MKKNPGLIFAFIMLGFAVSAQSLKNEEILEKAKTNIEKIRKGNASITFKDKNGKPVKNVNLEIHQLTHEFLFGCTFFDVPRYEDLYKKELYKQRFKDLFNFAVFPFYWSGYETEEGRPEWQTMIPAIEWCKQNGITTKGHQLVWSAMSGTPKWLYKHSISDRYDLLKSRVISITSSYKGLIDMWDVVNEPVNATTWDIAMKKMANEPGERYQDNPPINDIIGYVDDAYRWAHRGNPTACLILNEFYQIVSPVKREKFYQLIKELQKRQTPINGLGIQGHETRGVVWYSPESTWDTYNRLGELGLPLHITEIIPQSSGKEIIGGYKTGTWTEKAQAEFAVQIYTVSFGHPDVVSINWWGLSDLHIWQKGGGLLDKEYNPKPVYLELDRLINHEWKTNLFLTTNKDGKINFSGFYGKYKIILKTPETIKTLEVNLSKTEANSWEFTIPEIK